MPALHVVVGTSLLFFVLDWKLALLGAVMWPIVLIGPRLVAPRAARASYEKKTHESGLLATIDETLRGRRIVKALGLEPVARGWVSRDVQTLSRSSTRAGFLGALVERTTVLTIYALQVLVVIAGAVMAYRGSITVGVLVSFVTIFWNLGWSLVVLGRATPLVVSAAGSARRIDELLGEAPDPCENGDAAAPVELSDAIRFENVTFAYEKRVALLNVSFEIRRGQYVAFVGPSGSGKSTVMNLIARFEDPRDGKVTFDGVDARTISSSTLRRRLGFVLQDSFLFDTTVRENVRLGRAGASDADIEAAARSAEIHSVIEAMPDGYETKVGERGGRLSGGQRQRVAVARALVRDPKILLLDEATSALDPASEAAINETLEKARDGRTTIAITHRLSTSTHADCIFVLVDGRLVEKGTHPDLVAAEGVYADLWKKQQGFVVTDDGQSAEVTIPRLRSIALLAPLDEAQLATLSRRFVCERAAAGQTIIREGEPGALFYVIVRGTVSVQQKRAAGGESAELGRLSDGDQFGELALLNDSPRTATIVALTDCLFLTLPRPHFRRAARADSGAPRVGAGDRGRSHGARGGHSAREDALLSEVELSCSSRPGRSSGGRRRGSAGRGGSRSWASTTGTCRRCTASRARTGCRPSCASRSSAADRRRDERHGLELVAVHADDRGEDARRILAEEHAVRGAGGRAMTRREGARLAEDRHDVVRERYRGHRCIEAGGRLVVVARGAAAAGAGAGRAAAADGDERERGRDGGEQGEAHQGLSSTCARRRRRVRAIEKARKPALARSPKGDAAALPTAHDDEEDDAGPPTSGDDGSSAFESAAAWLRGSLPTTVQPS